MSGFQQQYSLWDEFLPLWATSRLTTITLDEYRSTGSKNSFKRKSKAVRDASVCSLVCVDLVMLDGWISIGRFTNHSRWINDR